MEKIVLNKIIKKGNTITYDFSASDGLSKYFSGKPFTIEYQENITSVPDSVAVIPFVCSVLPIIWLTDSELVLADIDKAFYECIPEVKKGYETMFPESTFAGKITAQKIIACDFVASDNSALMFSGGLDAVSSLATHLDEHPDLISVWGSDVTFDNVEGWNIVHKGIAEYSKKFNLNETVIRSQFRDFDCEYALNIDFSQQLKDGWWHGIKHSLALLGHVAPYVYLKGYSKLYIASTNCPEDEPVRCASNPIIDNHIKFLNCRVIHDGYEFNRQQKTANVVAFCESIQTTVSLHVCWESIKGTNCCKCEKCYRTLLGLIMEGADPICYGFPEAKKTIKTFRDSFINSSALTNKGTSDFWIHIQNRARENYATVKKTSYWKHIRWFVESDFSHPETIQPSLSLKIRCRLANFKVYQRLHHLKSHIKNQNEV